MTSLQPLAESEQSRWLGSVPLSLLALIFGVVTGFGALVVTFPQSAHGGQIRHVVLTEDDRILGVLCVNTAMQHASVAAQSGIAMRDIASRRFVVVRAGDMIFDVIQGIWHAGAMMAVVVRASDLPAAASVVGVLSQEQVAASLASSSSGYSE